MDGLTLCVLSRLNAHGQYDAISSDRTTVVYRSDNNLFLFTWGMNHMYYTALITDSYTFTTLTTHALSQLTLEQVR